MIKGEMNHILEKQVSDWTRELRRLADQISAATGRSCAVVLITPRDEEYDDVIPELIAEDALRVGSYGWPEGFEFEVLNPAKA